MVFITDVNGLMLNEKLVGSMTLEQAKASLSKIGFGMEKKVLACIEALEMGVQEAIIASGQVENPLSGSDCAQKLHGDISKMSERKPTPSVPISKVSGKYW